MKGKFRQLQLPEDLCIAAEQRFAPEFGGIEGLLEFVLQQLVDEQCLQLDREEQEAVENRLRELGYI